MFHEEARTFIKKVIRIREKLIENGESRMNPAIANRHISEIKRYLDYFGYRKDADMAMFWQRNMHRIMELIPGGDSNAGKGLMAEFNNLDSQRQHILTRKEYA
jgi:ribosomal 50S subunit-associated protein YjgA (DUF615 family)